jgi:O-antigen/teichoic acid export membrane protein
MTAITKISYFLRNIRQKGFFHLLSANILIQLFAFVSQLFVAGILSAEDIGRIKIIQTYLSIFSIIAGMGFNASTLKICSEHKSKQQLSEYFNSAFVFTLISSSLV